jgi:beta-glucosidase-like glycosyl hydrolase
MAIASAIDWKNNEDTNLLENVIEALSMEAIDVGINMPLIPVLDINQDPENPIICTRAFSDNRDVVSWFGTFYIQVLQKNGLISCAKHFPGHGDTCIDSHINLPMIMKSKDDLIKKDLYPFVEAIKAGVKAIMVGHLLVPTLDAKPATVSKKIVSDFLRNELGFNGLILSDALNMDALKGIDKIALNCFRAGIDILLHPLEPEETVKELTVALRNNEITIKEIEERLDRIFRMKSGFKRIPKKPVNYEENKRLSEVITEKSITLYKGGKDSLAINDPEDMDVYFFGENDLYDRGFMKRYFDRHKKNGKDTAIIAIFKSVSAWKGGAGLKDTEIEDIKRIVRRAKNSYIVSFGNPYILRHFKEADFLIAAYDASEHAQKAIVKALRGEIDLCGRMPVKIDI